MTQLHAREAFRQQGLLTDVEADATTEGFVAVRSLVTIRWIAIAGQLFCVFFAYYGMEAALNLPACLAAIATSAVMNMAAVWYRRQKLRLSARDATLFLAFDVLEIALMLYLTGGLNNPFAIFLLSPVAVAAGVLRFGSVTALTALTLLCLTLNAMWYLPLPWAYGTLEMPPRYAWLVWFTLVVSVTFIASYSWGVTRETRRMRHALNAAQVELANANQMIAMGALAAAVAHELGTPLATISLVSHELLRETDSTSPIREDVELLVSQSQRCRQVLADFARRPSAEGGDPYRILPLAALVEEAAQAHKLVSKALEVRVEDHGLPVLSVSRRPELVHGIGNIVQNAFQFAREKVQVSVEWTDRLVRVSVTDDGPGFPGGLLQKVGEPYISTRAHLRSGHMGLGVFIAKTLLERTRARVTFGNKPGGGARVVMEWARTAPVFVQQEEKHEHTS